jgi:hypothetical protein
MLLMSQGSSDPPNQTACPLGGAPDTPRAAIEDSRGHVQGHNRAEPVERKT